MSCGVALQVSASVTVHGDSWWAEKNRRGGDDSQWMRSDDEGVQTGGWVGGDLQKKKQTKFVWLMAGGEVQN